jgi:hypothetical protein
MLLEIRILNQFLHSNTPTVSIDYPFISLFLKPYSARLYNLIVNSYRLSNLKFIFFYYRDVIEISWWWKSGWNSGTSQNCQKVNSEDFFQVQPDSNQLQPRLRKLAFDEIRIDNYVFA